MKILNQILIAVLLCSSKNIQAEKPFVLPKGAIPIIYRHNAIYIPAKINDSISINFLKFDTGASGATNLDSTFFANMPFPNFRFGEVRVGGVGASGSQNLPTIMDTLSFQFGDHVYRANRVFISDRRRTSGDFNEGLIGHTPFSQNKYLMEFNYVDEYMILHNNSSTIDLSNYTKLDMIRENNRFYVVLTIQINDTLSATEYFLLDTGSGGSLNLSTPFTNRHNIPTLITNKMRAIVPFSGFGGQSTNVSFKSDFVEIGGYKLDHVMLRYSEDNSGSMAAAHVAAGLLGMRILEHFDMVIDFGDEPALYLKPNRNFNTPYEDLFMNRGFGYADRSQTLKGWVVSGLFEGSPAEKSDLQFGDKIIFVNGVSVLDIPHDKQRDFWKSLDKVELVVLRNDEEMKFEFEMNVVNKF
jgi:hypothetical protein